MKKRIIKGAMAFVLCCICVLTIVLCCGKKASAFSQNELDLELWSNVTDELTFDSYGTTQVEVTKYEDFTFFIKKRYTGTLNENMVSITGFDSNSIYCISIFSVSTNSAQNIYDLSVKQNINTITINSTIFPELFVLGDNASYCFLNPDFFDSIYISCPKISSALNISGYISIYKLIQNPPIVYDSFGNALLGNQLYYSQSNYINYGVDNYNDGLNSYYDGIEPMVLSNGTYYGGSSFVGINNDTPTRLYYSFDYGNDYLTFGGLNLSGDYDSYLLNIGFKDDYSITKVSFTPATSVTACIINGTRYTNVMYDGSYYYIDIPHIVSSEISFELSPRNDSSSISKNIKIEGIPDLTTLIYNSYYKGYNNGLESNQDKINLLEQQLNDGFNLFTPVTSFLNMKLSEFDILGTHFNLTFGLLLSFVLGLTAIFIIVKIFK